MSRALTLIVGPHAIPPRFAFANDPQPTRPSGTELLTRWRSGPLEIVATHTYVTRQFGPVSVALNGENLTDRRMTRVRPLLLPEQAPDVQ